MKHGVQIDMHQILKILIITAGHRIDRLIRIGHGIEKRIQTPLRQLNKGILHRKMFRTAQHRMFHNMSRTGGIHRRSPKPDIKYLILLLIFHQDHPGPGFLMSKQCPLRI